MTWLQRSGVMMDFQKGPRDPGTLEPRPIYPPGVEGSIYLSTK